MSPAQPALFDLPTAPSPGATALREGPDDTAPPAFHAGEGAATGNGAGPDRDAPQGSASAPRVEPTDGFPPPSPAFHANTPTARRSDPETSKDYDRGDPSHNLQCARVLIAVAGHGAHGAFCGDVVADIGGDRGNIARRLTDLHHRGLVSRDGTTRCRNGSRRQLVNVVTAGGRALLPAAHRLVEAS